MTTVQKTKTSTQNGGWTRRPTNGTSPSGGFRSRVESVGAHLPENRVTSRQVVESCAHQPEMDLEGVTGIVQRHISAPHEDSLTLAVRAANDCLQHSVHRGEDLDLLIFCGISKYHGGVETLRFEPPLSVLIGNAIGARHALTFDLANACAGMMTGLHVLHDFIRRGVARRGLVVSGEFISHLATNAARVVTDPRHLQAASLTLGDAGAAVIAERSDDDSGGILASEFTTFAEHVDLCTGWPCPQGPGGHMLTHAKEIHQHGILETPPVVTRALSKCGLKLDDIDYVITHQTAVRAIEKCSAVTSFALGSDRAQWMVNVDRCGNTASTSHFVALRRFLGEGVFQRGDRVLLIAQASGLVVGAVVLTIDQLGERYGRPD